MEASADVIVPRQAWADLVACLEGDGVSEEGRARLGRLGFFEEGASTDVLDLPSAASELPAASGSFPAASDFSVGDASASAAEASASAAEAAYESLSSVARDLLAPYWDSLGYVDLLVNDGGVVRHAAGWFGVDRASCVALDIDDSVALSLYEPGLLPVVMADLLDVGPRPVADPVASVYVPKSWVLELFEFSSRTVRDSLADELSTFWPEAQDAMQEGKWKIWTVSSMLAIDEALASDEGDARVAEGDEHRSDEALSAGEGETLVTDRGETFVAGETLVAGGGDPLVTDAAAADENETRGPICVLDTPAGYFSVVFEGESAAVRPVSTFRVWCALIDMIAEAA